MRPVRKLILVLLLLPLPSATLAQLRQEAQPASDEVLAKLQAAAIQHEAVALLIAQQTFQSIVPELKKIFDLDLPQEYEIYQVQEIQSVVQKLRDRRQHSIAHSAVDLGLRYMAEDKSKSSLYLLKSQLYRDDGQIREATEATEMARKFYQNSLRGTRPQ